MILYTLNGWAPPALFIMLHVLATSALEYRSTDGEFRVFGNEDDMKIPGARAVFCIDYKDATTTGFNVAISRDGGAYGDCTCPVKNAEEKDCNDKETTTFTRRISCSFYLTGFGVQYTFIFKRINAQNQDVGSSDVSFRSTAATGSESCLRNEEMQIKDRVSRYLHQYKQPDPLETKTKFKVDKKRGWLLFQTGRGCPKITRTTEMILERTNQDKTRNDICLDDSRVKQMDLSGYLQRLSYLPLHFFTETDQLPIISAIMPSGVFFVCLKYRTIGGLNARVCGQVELAGGNTSLMLVGQLRTVSFDTEGNMLGNKELLPLGAPAELTWPKHERLTISTSEVAFQFESEESGFVGDSSVSYVWTCTTVEYTSCPQLGSDKDKNDVRLKKDFDRKEGRIKLELTISWGKTKKFLVKTIVYIVFKAVDFPRLQIRCLLNCHDEMNPETELLVVAVCDDCKILSDYPTIEWDVTEILTNDTYLGTDYENFKLGSNWRHKHFYLSITGKYTWLKVKCMVTLPVTLGSSSQVGETRKFNISRYVRFGRATYIEPDPDPFKLQMIVLKPT